MAFGRTQNGGYQILPPTSNPAPSIVEPSLSNGTRSVASILSDTGQKFPRNSAATNAILSRTSIAKSDGLLRPIRDTPPSAPASPRLGP